MSEENSSPGPEAGERRVYEAIDEEAARAILSAIYDRPVSELPRHDVRLVMVGLAAGRNAFTGSDSSSPPAAPRGARELLDLAVLLLKQATNGWACYAKREVEHAEITRLHREIDALETQAKLHADAARPRSAPSVRNEIRQVCEGDRMGGRTTSLLENHDVLDLLDELDRLQART